MKGRPVARYRSDGRTRPLRPQDLKRGYVLRRLNGGGSSGSFADEIVVGVEIGDGVWVELARPYACVAADVLVGCERTRASFRELVESHEPVLLANGEPADCGI